MASLDPGVDETGYDDEDNFGGSAADLIRGDESRAAASNAAVNTPAPAAPGGLAITKPQQPPQQPPQQKPAPTPPTEVLRNPNVANMSQEAFEWKMRFHQEDRAYQNSTSFLRRKWRDKIAKAAAAKARATGDKSYLDAIPKGMLTPQLEQLYRTSSKMIDQEKETQSALARAAEKREKEAHHEEVRSAALKARTDGEKVNNAELSNGDPDLFQKLIRDGKLSLIDPNDSKRNAYELGEKIKVFGATDNWGSVGLDADPYSTADFNPLAAAKELIEASDNIRAEDKLELIKNVSKHLTAYTAFKGDSAVTSARRSLVNTFLSHERSYLGKAGKKYSYVPGLRKEVLDRFNAQVQDRYAMALEEHEGSVPPAVKNEIIKQAEKDAIDALRDTMNNLDKASTDSKNVRIAPYVKPPIESIDRVDTTKNVTPAGEKAAGEKAAWMPVPSLPDVKRTSNVDGEWTFKDKRGRTRRVIARTFSMGDGEEVDVHISYDKHNKRPHAWKPFSSKDGWTIFTEKELSKLILETPERDNTEGLEPLRPRTTQEKEKIAAEEARRANRQRQRSTWGNSDAQRKKRAERIKKLKEKNNPANKLGKNFSGN